MERRGKHGSVVTMVGAFADRFNDEIYVHSGSIDYYGGQSERDKWLPRMRQVATKHGVKVDIEEGSSYSGKAWFFVSLEPSVSQAVINRAMARVEKADFEMTGILLKRGVRTSAT